MVFSVKILSVDEEAEGATRECQILREVITDEFLVCSTAAKCVNIAVEYCTEQMIRLYVAEGLDNNGECIEVNDIIKVYGQVVRLPGTMNGFLKMVNYFREQEGHWLVLLKDSYLKKGLEKYLQIYREIDGVRIYQVVVERCESVLLDSECIKFSLIENIETALGLESEQGELPGLLKSLKNKLNILGKGVKRLTDLRDGSKIRKKFTDQLRNIDPLYKDIDAELDVLEEELNGIEDRFTCYEQSGDYSAGSKLEIMKFYYMGGNESWKLKLVNPTAFEFSNVRVWLMSRQLEIAFFHLIEPNATFYKDIKLQYKEEIYGDRLVASTMEFLVSDPVTIFPIEITKVVQTEDANTYRVKLVNKSHIEYFNIDITSPQCLEKETIQRSEPLGYDDEDTYVFTLSGQLVSFSVVILSENHMISNTFEYNPVLANLV